ncbi:protein kinase [Gemmatimonadota bacterium]
MLDLPDRLRVALEPRYLLEEEIGQGGMGTVFKAQDTRFDRAVAIKVLRPDVASAIASHRFEREIHTAAQLQHPHILPVYDSGEADGVLFFVTPFIEGENLRHLIDRVGELPVDQAVEIAREVASALDFAHRQGVVHRDIKPGNILLTEGGALVADFGIARAFDSSDRLTESGVALGTPEYMSPEQGTGSGDLGPTADIYALGCVLHEMLAGEPPFSGKTAQLTIARHIGQKPPSLRVVRPSIPEALVRTVEKALEKKPSDRFSTAARFSQSLASYRGGRLPEWVFPLRNRKGRIALGVISLLFFLAVGAWWWVGTAPLLEERAVILVADFQGPSEDPTLADAVRELVTTGLDQSRYLRALPRRDLNATMRLAEVPETTFVDVSLARQLAYRSAVRAVLAGTVEKLDGENFSLVLHLVDAADGSNLLSVATTGPDLILGAQDLTQRLREGAGERREAIEANIPLRQAATPSFEAYRKYVEAHSPSQGADVPAALSLLMEALELDPEFAAAWAAIGIKFLETRQFDSARAAFTRALENPQRLTDAQGYRLRADIAWTIDQDLEAAANWYSLYLDEVPNSVGGRNNRAIIYSSLGRYRDSVKDLEEAVRLNPFGPDQIQVTIMNLVAAYTVAGDLQKARQTLSDLSGPNSVQAELLVASAAADWATVGSLAELVEGDTSIRSFLRPMAIVAHSSSLAAVGRIESARELLKGLEIESSGAVARWSWQAQALLAMVSGGHPEVPSEQARSSDVPGGILLQGLHHAIAGDTSAANRALRELEGLDARQFRSLGYGPQLVQAWVAARGRRWAEVAEILGPAATIGEHDALNLDRPTAFAVRWLASLAFEELNEPDSAVALLERILDPAGLPPVHLTLRGFPYLFAHRRLGILYDLSGNEAAAESHWREFIDGATGSAELPKGLYEEAELRLSKAASF